MTSLTSSLYVVTSIPLKKPITPGKNSNAAPFPADAASDLGRFEASRSDLLAVFEVIRSAQESKSALQQFRSMFGVEKRAALAKEIPAALEAHATLTSELVKKYPQQMPCFQFYFWGAVLAERLNHAFDDYRYDLVNLCFNAAAVFHLMAQYLLGSCEGDSGSLITEAMEKEAYAYLISAASYFRRGSEVAATMVQHPTMSSKAAMLEDSKAGFLVMLSYVALDEAQWIGMLRAQRNDDNKNKEIVPKLTHRSLQLVNSALDVVNKEIVAQAHPLFKELVLWMKFKVLCYEALVNAQVAPCRFDKSAGEALWFGNTAETALRHATLTIGKQSLASLPTSKEWIGYITRTVAGAVDRVRQMNNLVSRERVAEGPLSLPTAQELARCKDVAVQCPIPEKP